MIRSNPSLHCNCIDGIGCANGVGFCDETSEGKPRCRKIGKVKPIDMIELEQSIRVDVIIASIGNPIQEIAVRENRTTRTLELFNDTYTASTDSRGDKWNNINHKETIEKKLQDAEIWKNIDRYYMSPKYYTSIAKGVEAILTMIPIANELTINNTFLKLAYSTAKIDARLQALSVETVLANLDNIGMKPKRDNRTIDQVLSAIPDYDYAADDKETAYLYFETVLGA